MIAEHVLKFNHKIAWDRVDAPYKQWWGASNFKEYLHIKREHANRQLVNTDGDLAFSRVWQQVISLTATLI